MLFMAKIKIAACIVVAVAFLAGTSGQILVAQDSRTPARAQATGTLLPTSDNAALGSPNFYPSPEHPVGWRGDGSGRFPGATPPVVWSRRLVDITSEIMVQAVKPRGKPGADSHALGYFTVKDWLIAGPFPAADPEKDIDTDFLDGEAGVQPDTGAKAGNTLWKAHRAYEGSQSYRNCNEYTTTHMWVDFVNAFGKIIPPENPSAKGYEPERYANLDKQAAYAHTYLYSPRQSDVYMDIMHDLPAVKIWVNGAPQRVLKGKGGNLKIHLNEGWNRLLVKAICDKAQMPWKNQYADPKDVLGQTKWRFATYIRSANSGPFSYETRNVSWMVKLTGRNCSQPIVVGDKLFVGSNNSDLLCLDKKSGRILWMHTGTYWDAMTAEERAAVKDTAGPLLKELDRTNAELVLLLNENIKPQGLDSTRQTAIDQKLGERKKFLKSVHDSLSAGQKGKLYLNEVSAGDATPTSDGKQVYWVVQGDGGYLTTAFDLNGKLLWSNLEFQKAGAGEHGSHRSPLLFQGRLLVGTRENLIAYDAATGKELWRTPGSEGHGVAGTPIVVQVDGQPALQTATNLVGLNGDVLAEGGYNVWGCFMPVVEDGVLYSPCNRRGDWSFEALGIPKKPGAKPGVIWKLDAKTLYGLLVGSTGFFYIASPLYVDGLLYQVEMSGILVVVDTRARKRDYLHWMDGYNFNDRSLYGFCASPTLAGKNIYLMDSVGYMTILKPGPEFAAMGSNFLQNITSLPANAPGKQEVFYAGMFFDGKRMFLHGDEYLYCIEEK